MARRVPILLFLSALAVLVLASSPSKALPPAPSPSCSPGPADCGSWHTTDVTVSWGVAPCSSVTISTDGTTPVSCTWTDGSGSVTTTVNVRRDATPPSVTASPDRGPDNNGWYNRQVSIAFSGDDGASGVASCSSASYNGPDTGGVAVSGTCTDNAGNTGRTSTEIKYDGTPPTVEVKPDRLPNTRGWYNRRVIVAFVGSDPTSGVDSCAAPVTYQGPDAPQATVSGTCTDKASNTSPPVSFALKYDTKPPTLGRVKAEITSRGVVLRWTASKDALSFGIVRRPGLKGKKPSTLYSGRAGVFTDGRLRKGVRYRYTVTAYDEAGNAAVKALATQLNSPLTNPAVPRPSPTTPTGTRPALTKPTAGARLAAPPLLAWTPVPKATYYNVQLYRDGQKILTVWPRAKTFLLQRSWQFGGRSYRLTPGRYVWYVWPGFGPRSANRYGKLLGTRSFVVTR